MAIREDLKVERYKLATSRQEYFTDLAKETFSYYVKIFISLSSGAIALVSLNKPLVIGVDLLSKLLFAIGALLSIVGLISICQIIFCLIRWYIFHDEECQIDPDCRKAEWWACLFEGMYVVAIASSIMVLWYGIGRFDTILHVMQRSTECAANL
jgi:hypothetical protein